MTDGIRFSGSGTVEKIDRMTSAKGTAIVTLVVRVGGKWPQLVPVRFIGRAAEAVDGLGEGEAVEVSGDVGGREWNGKYYADVTGRSVRSLGALARPPGAQHREVKAGEPLPGADDEVPL